MLEFLVKDFLFFYHFKLYWLLGIKFTVFLLSRNHCLKIFMAVFSLFSLFDISRCTTIFWNILIFDFYKDSHVACEKTYLSQYQIDIVEIFLSASKNRIFFDLLFLLKKFIFFFVILERDFIFTVGK